MKPRIKFVLASGAKSRAFFDPFEVEAVVAAPEENRPPYKSMVMLKSGNSIMLVDDVESVALAIADVMKEEASRDRGSPLESAYDDSIELLHYIRDSGGRKEGESEEGQ